MSTSLLRLAAAAMPPAKPLLREAVAAWRPGAAYYSGANDALVDITGNGEHVMLGTAVGSDTNDPIMIDYAGGPSMWVPPTSSGSNYARTAGVAYNGTDRLDLRALVYEPASLPWHVEAIGFRGPNPVVANLYVNNGQMRLAYNQGSGNIFDPGVGITLPRPVWVRAVVDPVPGTLDYYQSSDGENWQLRLSKVLPTPGPIRTDTTEARAGNVSLGTLGSVASRVGRAYILVNGEPFIDFDPADSAEPDESWVSSRTGETWTITRSTSGYAASIIRRPVALLDGADDVFTGSADNAKWGIASGETLTGLVVFRTPYHAPQGGVLIGPKRGFGVGNAGWRMTMNTPNRLNIEISDSINQQTLGGDAPSVAVRETSVAAFVATTTHYQAFLNGVQVIDLARTVDAFAPHNLRIGRDQFGNPAPIEFYGAAVFRRVLTPEEQMRVAAELGVNV